MLDEKFTPFWTVISVHKEAGIGVAFQGVGNLELVF